MAEDLQPQGRDAILLSTATRGKQNANSTRHQRNDRRGTPRVRRVAPRRRVGGLTHEGRAREPRGKPRALTGRARVRARDVSLNPARAEGRAAREAREFFKRVLLKIFCEKKGRGRGARENKKKMGARASSHSRDGGQGNTTRAERLKGSEGRDSQGRRDARETRNARAKSQLQVEGLP
jgi:hypothetical protein